MMNNLKQESLVLIPVDEYKALLESEIRFKALRELIDKKYNSDFGTFDDIRIMAGLESSKVKKEE